jgi:hypothetical protein
MSIPPSFLRQMFLAAFVLLLPQVSFSQAAARPLPLSSSLGSPLQDKNFYLLALLQKNNEVRRALVADQEIAAIRAERKRSVERELAQCKENVACTLKGLLWSDEEIHTVSLALARLYRENKSVRLLVDRELRPSGAYVLYQKQSGENLLANAWDTCARGLNDVISVYGEGAAPRYPLIDSFSFDVNSADYQQRIHSLVSENSTGTSPSALYFDPSLNAALQLLALSHRDEAGRLEPMETGVNAAAVKAIAATSWNKFAYSVIVVPGAGPGDRDTALSNSGRKRVQLAAEAYHAGKAPVILVSGGYVHPSQTRFSEAVEMKKALLQDYNVPESAILIDPHARHTTTNMRNAAREIYRYGVPMNKTALVISDAAQIGYIAGQPFADRCLKELGYMPYRILSQPSDTSLAFLPLVESLEQDPIEPLDP